MILSPLDLEEYIYCENSPLWMAIVLSYQATINGCKNRE
jgi:hypothetical protein